MARASRTVRASRPLDRHAELLPRPAGAEGAGPALVDRAALELCDDGRLSVAQGASRRLHLEEPARVNAEIIRFLSAEDRGGAGG